MRDRSANFSVERMAAGGTGLPIRALVSAAIAHPSVSPSAHMKIFIRERCRELLVELRSLPPNG